MHYVDPDSAEDALSLIEISVMLDQVYDQLIHLKNIMERIVESIPANETTFKSLAQKALSQINLHDALLI